MSTRILLKVYMSKEEKQAVKEYVASKKLNVSSFVKDLVLKEINNTPTL